MSTEDAAARVVRQQFEYQNTGRHAEAAAQFAGDAINNGRPASGGRIAGILATLAEVFPDERHNVEELVSDGELVAARVRFTGTHSAMPSVPFVLGGVLADIPPTGRSVSVATITSSASETAASLNTGACARTWRWPANSASSRLVRPDPDREAWSVTT